MHRPIFTALVFILLVAGWVLTGCAPAQMGEQNAAMPIVQQSQVLGEKMLELSSTVKVIQGNLASEYEIGFYLKQRTYQVAE